MEDRLLDLHEVKAFTGLCKATIYQHVHDGRLPKPIKLGKSTRWVESELMAWLEAKKAERGA